MSPHPFRWAVTLLAVRASCGTGLLAGTALLVANNPRRSGQPPQLSYPALLKLSMIPLALAALAAVAGGFANASAQVGSYRAAALGVDPDRVRLFVVVWAIHAGSYGGALLGTVVSVLVVFARRWRGQRRHLGSSLTVDPTPP